MQRRVAKYFSAAVLLCAIWCVIPAYAQEAVNVTQDQLELRSDPADNDENILGTLRANTPVTFTGKVSGKWYQITAPNGQTGWVHQSGVSRPKSLAKPTPTPKPAATPKAEKTPSPAKPTSRAVQKPAEKQPEQPSKSQKAALEELEKQYKAQLDEKDRRIAELSKELDDVETKLTDAGKMASDLEQLRKSDEANLAEIQTQIASLNETIQQKEQAIASQKNEFAALQEELNKQIASQKTSSLQRALLLVSLPLNLLGLVLLGYFGIRHIANKQEKQAEALPHLHDTDHFSSEITPAEKPIKRPSSDAVKIQIGKETADPQLKDLDVVMTAPVTEIPNIPSEENVAAAQEQPAYEEQLNLEETVEETVIDLGDMLEEESSERLAMDVSEPGVIITEETIIVDEPIEIVREEIPESETEPIPTTPEAPVLSETLENEVIEEEFERIEPVEEPAPVASVIEELDEIDVQGIEDDVELEFDDDSDEIEETPIEETETETLAIDDENMEALLVDTPEIEQAVDMDGLLEPGELEEPAFDEIEIAGERFETLPEHGTQIIEMNDDEEEPYAETPVEGESEIADDIMLESEPGIIEEIEDEQEIAARTIVQAPRAEAAGEEAIEFEAEEPSFANLRVHEEIDELLDMVEPPFQGERAPKQEADLRGFAEPSPYLIEPEHDQEELETTAVIDDDQPELKYAIELVKVGRNRDHVIHILSKVQGLPKTPEELLASTPCTIARGANKQDAQNFQMLMKKFGAEVRLTQHAG